MRRNFSSDEGGINFLRSASNFGAQKGKNLASSAAETLPFFEEEHDPYSAANHTLVPYLYLYQFFEDNVGYVLMEPKTRALIAVDVGEFDKSFKIISELEHRFDT